MGINVLVVDDSAVMRAMIIKTLRLSGVPLGEIYQGGSGEEGLQSLGDNWIDLALVDLNMPVMDGEEMIRRVRQNPETADLAIVVVSTEGSETRIQTLQEKGAGFIHKPFMPEVLREAIQRVTGAPDGEQDGDSAIPGGG